MGTCKDCKWWGARTAGGSCHECTNPKQAAGVELHNGPLSSLVIINVRHFTGPERGCEHWEAKE